MVIIEQIPSVQNIIEETCKQKKNQLTTIKKEDIKNKRYEQDFQLFDYKDTKDIKVNLKGDKQFENAAVCLETIKIIEKQGYAIKNEKVRKGLSTVIHKARFETLQENPTIIYDGGHNEEAITNFVNTVNQYYSGKEKIYILSILKTKDYKTVIQKLLQHKSATFIFTSGNDKERYVAAEELYHTAKQIAGNANLKTKTLEEAILYAKEQKNKVTFIVGSFYIYGDVIKILKNNIRH